MRTGGYDMGPQPKRSLALLMTFGFVGATLAIIGPSPLGAAQTCFGQTPTIFASAGEPTVGTAGDDVIMGTSGPDKINAGGGNDLVCAQGGADRVLGQGGDDKIDLGSGADTAKGGSGDDLIRGKAGPDRIFGNRGADRLIGGGSADNLVGGSGPDNLKGGGGKDQLKGGGGADELNGGAGNDRCLGGGGTDDGTRCEETASVESDPKATEPEPEQDRNCHPSYTPCLPRASDYDCYGGSGDGPKYAGRVTIHGPDDYRLNNDNDNIGCDHLPPHEELFPS